jgi:hypothetical protein
MTTRRFVGFTVLLGLIAGACGRAHAQGSVFTYQGQLKRSGSPTNGPCDFRFELFDAEQAGTQIGPPNTRLGVGVNNGLFTVQLDFGDNAFRVSEEDFFAAPRWLQLSVRCPAGSGNYSSLQPRQLLTAAPHALYAPLIATDADGNVRAVMDTFSDGSGFVRTRGPNGTLTVLMSTLDTGPNNGFLGVFDEDGERAAMLAGSGGAGIIRTEGPNGNENTYLGFLNANPDHGYLGVSDASGEIRAAMFVNAQGEGEFFADVKNFAVDHPTRADAKIVYTSLEGPEAAIYHRGVVRLRDGRAIIELPEHFSALANPDTITVQLTPRSFDSKGLGFGAIHDNRIEVRELQHGRGAYDVHFVIHAVRRGYEERSPVVARETFSSHFRPGVVAATADRARTAARLEPPPVRALE